MIAPRPVLALGLLAALAGTSVGAAPGEARTATILMVNDTYRIGGVEGGQVGGIPRLRALRQELERDAPDLLVLHAGDFLFPSSLSRRFGGAQMVDLLNRLDGDAEAFDPRLWVTFGNHEFDRDRMHNARDLAARIRESQFTWLGTNIRFVQDEAGRPLVRAPNLQSAALATSGGVRVGLFSITTDVHPPEYVETFERANEVALRMTALLRQQGADLVVALTHFRVQDDLALLETLGSRGPDLIIGGHEHDRQVHQAGGHRLVIKADADARTAGLIRAHLDHDGGLRIDTEFRILDAAIEPDPGLQARVQEWEERFRQETCRTLGAPDGCLAEPLGRSRVPLIAEELSIRRFETNLGNFVADQALAAFRDQGAQIAFVNSGSLRLNEDLPAGIVTRERLLDLFAYPSPLVLLRLDGATLQRIVDRAVRDWTGNGWWLQIAGFAFRHDPSSERALDLTLLTPQGPRPVRPDETLLAVIPHYLADSSRDQDGYTMIEPAALLTSPKQAPDLRDRVAAALGDAEPEGIAPTREGRICTRGQEGPCLALTAPGLGHPEETGVGWRPAP